MLLANGLSTFPIKGNVVFSNGSKSLPKSPPNYPILSSWFFDYFILAKELFAKAFESIKTWVLANINLQRKKILSPLES